MVELEFFCHGEKVIVKFYIPNNKVTLTVLFYKL